MEPEPIVGKGLSGALKLARLRGLLNQDIEWCGRNSNKDEEGDNNTTVFNGKAVTKEIRIERRDEHGRVLTPKEAFRRFCHSFHGIKPGFKQRQKRITQYRKELAVKKMTFKDTPLNTVERMQEAQHKLQTAHLLLSGHCKI